MKDGVREAARSPFASSALRCVVAVVVLLTAVSLSVQARAQPAPPTAAENFVRSEMETGLAILNDRSESASQRRTKLRAFLESFMDIRRVALFSLGFARHNATPQQVDQFVDVFRSYVVADFESLLSNYYSGQAVRITGCSQDSPDSYTVDIALEHRQADAQDSNQPIDINVRVVEENGKFVITDLAALGIWLSVKERDDVKEYLLETNGNFSGLLMRYRVRTQRRLSEPPNAVGYGNEGK